MYAAVYHKPDRTEMTAAIELHQREIKTVQENLKEDIKRLEEILTKIYDRLMSNN